MNSTALTATKTYENEVVLVSNENYVIQNLDSIMEHLRREVDARAEVKDDVVKIVCDLGIKKFEGRTLRKLLVKEIKRVIKEVLNIHWHRNLM